jgi:putative addiction module component (TIGR02574 family)
MLLAKHRKPLPLKARFRCPTKHFLARLPRVEMPDIARLTPEERLELIGRLWDSLESEDVRLTPSQDAELGRRMATFEAAAKGAVSTARRR